MLRAGSNFLRPHGGQSSADNLLNYTTQGGFPIALENLYRTGSPLVQQIVDNWRTWRHGVPTQSTLKRRPRGCVTGAVIGMAGFVVGE